MYKTFFGLKKSPFNVNPDPSYLYLTPQMRQALDELTYGIQTRKGLMLLTGEAGTGKTTLLNHLLLWLGHQHAKTAFIFNSHLDSNQLFDFILSDFGIPSTPQSKSNPLIVFNEWLVARYRAHDLVVLVVDEAQGLPVHVLEELRLLQNMETPHEKMVQIILAGQPELELKLKRPDLRQLHQRIALRAKTAPLTLPETHAYIEDRLHTAGARDESIFSSDAIEAIHGYSRGIPRVINLLCETAMINAYADQQRLITSMFIDEAACELQFDDLRPATPRLKAVGNSDQDDLHSVLARIQEDAEAVRVWQQKASPYLVASQRITDNIDAVMQMAQSNVRTIKVAEISKSRKFHKDASGETQHDALIKPELWTELSARVSRLGTAFSNSAERTVQSVSALGLVEKVKGFGGRIAEFCGPAMARVSRKMSPKITMLSATASQYLQRGVSRLDAWFARHFHEESYAKSVLAVAISAAVLYRIARRIDPSQSWQHPLLMILGFAGFLLWALLITTGVAILVRARHRLRADSNVVVMHAVRWLRAPIHSRSFDATGRVVSERRAS